MAAIRGVLVTTSLITVLVAPTASAAERQEHRPLYSPDGSRVVFMSMSEETGGDWELFVMEADGGHPRRLTTHPGWDGYAVWSPDGRRIVFDRGLRDGGEEKAPYWLDLESGEEGRLGTYDGWLSVNDWSSKRDLLAFWERDGQRDLYLLKPDGTIARRLTETAEESEHDAHFSPDGRRIAFAVELPETNREEASAVDMIDLDTGDRRRLRTSMGRIYGISWSPDGRSLAYTDAPLGEDDDADIFVLDLGDGEIARVTDDPAWDHMPVWAPDGERILFTSYRTGEERMYSIDLESGESEPLRPAD